MAVNQLTDDERELVRALEEGGWNGRDALATVVMACRVPSRPRLAMIDWLTQFASLESTSAAAEALDKLRADQRVREHAGSNGVVLFRPAPGLLEGLLSLANWPPERASGLRRDPCEAASVTVNLVGPVAQEQAYTTYLDCLRHAQIRVNLPIFRPSIGDGAAAILQERAQAGVKVRILIASDDVISTLWGSSAAASTRHIRAAWVARSGCEADFEVRVCHSVNRMRLATSWSVDGRLARFDAFDYRRERPLDGYMVDISSKWGSVVNVVECFDDQFDEAWRRSSPVSRAGWLLWRLQRAWQWAFFSLFLGLSLASVSNPALSGVFASAAAAFLINAIVASHRQLRDWWARALRGRV